jgi:hypothetical protein
VDIPAALATDLASLTAALATPGTDLEALLAGLSRRIRVAVPSCVGLSMTVVVNGFPLTLATIDEVADVAASMRLPLSALGSADPGSVVTFYSAKPGAFVDLAADAAFTLGERDDRVVLDDDIHPSAAPSGLGGLDALSAVNRAIGYLIGEGWTPEGADAELHRRARAAGVSRHDAALHVTRAATE